MKVATPTQDQSNPKQVSWPPSLIASAGQLLVAVPGSSAGMEGVQPESAYYTFHGGSSGSILSNSNFTPYGGSNVSFLRPLISLSPEDEAWEHTSLWCGSRPFLQKPPKGRQNCEFSIETQGSLLLQVCISTEAMVVVATGRQLTCFGLQLVSVLIIGLRTGRSALQYWQTGRSILGFAD